MSVVPLYSPRLYCCLKKYDLFQSGRGACKVTKKPFKKEDLRFGYRVGGHPPQPIQDHSLQRPRLAFFFMEFRDFMKRVST